MSPSIPPAGSAVPEEIPADNRAAALLAGIRAVSPAAISRVLLISRAPYLTFPSSPESGTKGYPAAVAASPTATTTSSLYWLFQYSPEPIALHSISYFQERQVPGVIDSFVNKEG